MRASPPRTILRLSLFCPLALALALALAVSGCRTIPPVHVGPVTGLVVDGGEVFGCSQAGVRIGDQADARWIHPSFRATCLDVRGDAILVGGGDPAESGTVALYTRSGNKLAEQRVSDDLVYSVSIRWDGAEAAVGCADGSVRVLSLPDLRILGDKTRHTAPCRVVRYGEPFLATGGLDGLIYLHDHRTGEETVFKDHTDGVECLQFHEGRLYSGARDGKVRVHEERLSRTYQGMRQPVLGLAVSGGRCFAGLQDGQIYRLGQEDATYGRAATLDRPLFAMAADGDALLVGTQGGAARLVIE